MAEQTPFTPAPGIARVRLAGLFLCVTLGFVAFRGSSCLVWDDSTGTSMHDSNEADQFDALVAARRAALAADPLGTLANLVVENFSECSDAVGYRPVSTLYLSLCSDYFYDHHQHSPWHLLLVGAFYGAFAVCFLRVARRFVRREITAWFALVLVLGSPPAAATSWVFMSFLQIIMPLIICAALLAYWSWQERGSRWALTGLCLLWLIGPWAREILFVVPVLVGYLELERARRPTWLMGLAALAFAHALYPTALVKLVFFPDLPLRSMFAMGGHVTTQLAGAPLRWYAALHFLPLFPPSLWVIAVFAGLVPGASGLPTELEGARSRWRAALDRSRVLLAPAVLALAAALAWYDPARAATAFCLLVPALAWRRGSAFLAGWFLALFLPMLRVFTEHIHFLYAVVPAALILAGAAESLWESLSARRVALAWLRHGVATVALLAAADQALTLYGTFHTMHVTYDGIDTVAVRLQRELRRDDILVANVLHGEEIWYHAGYFYWNYMAIPWGIPDQDRCVADPAAFRELLKEPGRADLYLLDVDFDYLPGKVAHRHKYVHRYDVEKQDLGVLHVTRGRYPFCDPLRHLIPREYVPFLGAPDLVNDFYCGRARNGRWFRYEVHAVYHLYRVTGRDLSARLEGPVSLAEEGVQGFNILRIGEGYLAFPCRYGAFDSARYRRGEYGHCLTGLTAEEVRRKILAKAGVVFNADAAPATP